MELIIFIILLALGLIFGRLAEAKHFRSIIAREAETKHLLAFSARFPPPDKSVAEAGLVSGNVVVSVDYFKRFVAGLRALVGGRMKSYETLMERARREALLRMKADAIAQGHEQIFNVKLETASIYKGKKGTIGSVEVYAYGTGLTFSGSN